MKAERPRDNMICILFNVEYFTDR